MSRLQGAIETIRGAIATAADMPPANCFSNDDDLIDDLGMDELELESLQLIIEEIFAISISAEIWRSPLYRTAASLAGYCIRKSDEASWAESRSGARPRAAGCA